MSLKSSYHTNSGEQIAFCSGRGGVGGVRCAAVEAKSKRQRHARHTPHSVTFVGPIWVQSLPSLQR